MIKRPQEPVDWIYANDALDLARDAFGNSKGLSVLEQALRDGRIWARAKVHIVEVDFGKISSRPPKSKTLSIYYLNAPKIRTIHIGSAFWGINEKSMFEPELWQWANNIFAYVTPSPYILVYDPAHYKNLVTPAMRTVMYDVTLRRSDLLEIIRTDITEAERGRRSRLTKSERLARVSITEYDWERVLKELQQHAKSGTLEDLFGDFEKRGSQAKLEREINDLFFTIYGEMPSNSTCRRMAVKLRDLNARCSRDRGEPS